MEKLEVLSVNIKAQDTARKDNDDPTKTGEGQILSTIRIQEPAPLLKCPYLSNKNTILTSTIYTVVSSGIEIVLAVLVLTEVEGRETPPDTRWRSVEVTSGITLAVFLLWLLTLVPLLASYKMKRRRLLLPWMIGTGTTSAVLVMSIFECVSNFASSSWHSSMAAILMFCLILPFMICHGICLYFVNKMYQRNMKEIIKNYTMMLSSIS